MHPVIQKTFGGLTKQYYFRQLFFGAIFAAIIIFMTTRGNNPPMYGIWVFSIICTLLYPYSRFVYESIVGFIMGDNVFFTSAIFMMLIKYLTMSLCWQVTGPWAGYPWRQGSMMPITAKRRISSPA